jgi:hypothetical protein
VPLKKLKSLGGKMIKSSAQRKTEKYTSSVLKPQIAERQATNRAMRGGTVGPARSGMATSFLSRNKPKIKW